MRLLVFIELIFLSKIVNNAFFIPNGVANLSKKSYLNYFLEVNSAIPPATCMPKLSINKLHM